MPTARTFSIDSIVLKRMDYGEADRILTVLSRRYGKLRLLAKGVRRTQSKLAGHLEPFAHAQLMVAKGRNLDVVTQAMTMASFWEIRESLERSSYAFHFAELVDAFVQDADEHQGVFDLLRDSLATLASTDRPPALVARHFEMHLLDEAGFRPQLEACVACEASVQPVTNGYSVPRGGVFCPTCTRLEPSAVPLEVPPLKLLRFLQRTPQARSLTLEVPVEVLEHVEIILRRQLEFSLERKLRAVAFVREVAESAWATT